MPKKSLPALLFILAILLLFHPAFLEGATQSTPQKEPPKVAPETKTTVPEARLEGFIPNSDCLGCHGEKIDEKKFLTSVHATHSCTSCHQNVTHIDQHEKTRGAKAKPESATCHSDDGYSEIIHGQSVLGGNPDFAMCSDGHALHWVPILEGEEPEGVQFRKELHTEVCQRSHADKEMMERNRAFLIAWEFLG